MPANTMVAACPPWAFSGLSDARVLYGHHRRFRQRSRYQRLIIALAGVWSELYICSMATLIWWGTAPDTLLHDGAYFMMLMTGIAGLLINWNPLMKLDGYYMLSELLDVADLKENSTAYVSAWVKRHIWRLPVDVPYVPRTAAVWFCGLRAAVWRLQLYGALHCRALCGKRLPQLQSRVVLHSGNCHSGPDLSIPNSKFGELYEIRLSGQKRPYPRRVRLAPRACRSCFGDTFSVVTSMARVCRRSLCDAACGNSRCS